MHMHTHESFCTCEDPHGCVHETLILTISVIFDHTWGNLNQNERRWSKSRLQRHLLCMRGIYLAASEQSVLDVVLEAGKMGTEGIRSA